MLAKPVSCRGAFLESLDNLLESGANAAELVEEVHLLQVYGEPDGNQAFVHEHLLFLFELDLPKLLARKRISRVTS